MKSLLIVLGNQLFDKSNHPKEISDIFMCEDFDLCTYEKHHKNNNGWIHVSQLRKAKSFIPLEDKIIFKKPSKFSKPIAQIKKGRLLLIKKPNIPPSLSVI